MKTDPLRVARILKDGFAMWKAETKRKGPVYRGPDGKVDRHEAEFDAAESGKLSSFCGAHRFSYKLVSKWMTKGLRYVHPDSEAQLRRLCAVLQVKYADLWEVPTDSLSVEDVAEAIRLLAALQALMQKSLDRVKALQKAIEEVKRPLPRGKSSV